MSTARDAMKAYEEKINLHAFDEVRDLIDENAVCWFSDGSSHHGIAAIEAVFVKTRAALANETYWLEDVRWIAEGDLAAACTYRFNWKAIINGEEGSGWGRGATVLSRASGRWKIVHEHLSKGEA